MVSNISNVYDRVVAKHGLDPKLVKSIGDAVFQHTKDRMLSFQDGSVYLSHVGSFTLKSRTVERQLIRYLSMRKYLYKKNKDYLNMPPAKKIMVLFNLYFKIILPFKKKKREISALQREYCKKVYESYEKSTDMDTE